MKDVNLKAMLSIKDTFGIEIGYSDHTKPDSKNLILNSAFLLGAEVFEKHFTFDRKSKGNDHYHSMDLELMKKWIDDLNLISSARSYEETKFIDMQSKARTNARRGIYASKNIALGEVLNENNITTLRPVASLSASQWDEVIGTIAKSDFMAGEEITN